MKTKILYFSRTGNLELFANKLRKQGYTNIEAITPGMIVNEPFVLVASTIYFGEVPVEYKRFLRDNPSGLIGVSGSGNRNWGRNFAIAADIIAERFDVPVISKFDLSGNVHDLKAFVEGVEKLEATEEFKVLQNKMKDGEIINGN